MAVPRILFTRFTDSASPKLVPLAQHRARILGRGVQQRSRVQTEDRLAVVWQLVSGNNRELARSADIFDDFADALVSATELVELVAEHGEAQQVSDEKAGVYGWYLNLLGHPAALCPRWYRAERERRQAIELALAALPKADIARGARQYVDARSAGSRYEMI